MICVIWGWMYWGSATPARQIGRIWPELCARIPHQRQRRARFKALPGAVVQTESPAILALKDDQAEISAEVTWKKGSKVSPSARFSRLHTSRGYSGSI